jgi:hypothetical protein
MKFAALRDWIDSFETLVQKRLLPAGKWAAVSCSLYMLMAACFISTADASTTPPSGAYAIFEAMDTQIGELLDQFLVVGASLVFIFIIMAVKRLASRVLYMSADDRPYRRNWR